jgi:hypothetical protein
VVGSAGSLIPERPWLIAIPKRPGVLSLSLSLSSSVSVSIPLSIPDTLLYPFPFSTHSPSLPIPLFSTQPSLLYPSSLSLLYPSSLASNLALPFLPYSSSLTTCLFSLSYSSHSLSFSLTIHLHVDGQSGRRQVKTNTV